MAHFAELDENNIVLRVVVVDNKNILDANNSESGELGIAYCRKIFGQDTRWKQTSYNGNFRIRYAGIGYIYYSDLDAFVLPRPFLSWNLNKVTAKWEPPIPEPELTDADIANGNNFEWDEDNLCWEKK
jgi:hypothetical protein